MLREQWNLRVDKDTAYRAYQPEQLVRWLIRPQVDLISKTLKGLNRHTEAQTLSEQLTMPDFSWVRESYPTTSDHVSRQAAPLLAFAWKCVGICWCRLLHHLSR